LWYFFFQAEDGIRDDLVTGVQTCALPIFSGQTFESTTATSTAIAKVAELSAGLRKSAAGFRLPGNAGDRASATGTVRRLEDTTLTTAKVRQISALGGS